MMEKAIKNEKNIGFQYIYYSIYVYINKHGMKNVNSTLLAYHQK